MSGEMTERLKFVTGNEDKAREARRILGIEIERVEPERVVEIQTVDVSELIFHKIGQVYRQLKCPVMVEDSGLIFTAWNGLPGALVKWFEKTVACDGLARMLDGFTDRSAIAVCVAALHDGEKVQVGRGEVRGTIAPAPRGTNGFGWDTIFIPAGHDRTFAEMTAEEKDAISHRKLALDQLKKHLIAGM
jgi:XTP/dITP diphosphohydrolase